MRSYIAVDVGGTQIRAACYLEDNLEPVRVQRTATQGQGENPLERLMAAIQSVWPDNGSVQAIGVAAPGPMDPYQGIVLAAPNIPGWTNLPLQRKLEERFNVNVATGNDANLAALGEWRFGAGQGHHHLIYLTVSTGIGGGVIVDDRMLLGVRGLAAELGHVTVIPDGPLCGCGHRGHLEAISSGTAIARWVEQELAHGCISSLPVKQTLTSKQIAEAARQGDELAIAALARAGTFLGVALAGLLHTFNPSAIIIGGGVARCGSLLFDPMQAALRENVMTPDYLENLVITTAALGDSAGLMGALALAHLSVS
jgi:glucokinase